MKNVVLLLYIYCVLIGLNSSVNAQDFYPRYPSRFIHRMNGLWDFVFLGDVLADSIDVSTIKFNDSMAVPACFDATPSYAGKRGLVAYRTNARLTANSPSLLYFGSVSFWAKVFVDKQQLAVHSPSYYPFWVNVSPTSSVERELIVLVDNRFNSTTSVLQYPNFDYYQYGGINRDVYWYEVQSSFMQRVEISTDLSGTVSLALIIGGNIKNTFNIAVEIGSTVTSKFSQQPNDKGIINLPSIPMNNPYFWRPESPHLYGIKISLMDSSNNILDVHETRFGFRKVEAKNGGIYLNGEQIQLRGVNRHEAHPEFGPALPYSLLLSDIQMLKKLGANYVRGAHYPQDPRWMDLCDQFGILLWVENIAWGYDAKLVQNPMFLPAQVAAMDELIDESFNHPSVIIYGFLNECPSDNKDWNIVYTTLVNLIKGRNTGRLITYASNRGQNDIYMGLVDIASFNTYPGWYDSSDISLDELLSHITIEMDALQHWASKNYPGKPITISEIGAGAIYGWRDELNGFWTETYQSEYLSLAMGHVIDHPQRFSGISLWQFFDIRTYSGARDLGRPKGFNNKDPFEEDNYQAPPPKIHVRIIRRIGKKCLTSVDGLPQELDSVRLMKAMRKVFNCNGAVMNDPELGTVIQLSGDQRENVVQFLLEHDICTREQLAVPGL